MSYLDVLFLKDLFPGLLIEMNYSDLESLYGVLQGSMWNIPSSQGRLLQDHQFYTDKIKDNYGTDQLPEVPGVFPLPTGIFYGQKFQSVKDLLILISTMPNLSKDQQLTLAAQIGSVYLVKNLVKQTDIVMAVDSINSLLAAAAEGRLDIVKYLVEHGADVTAYDQLGIDAVQKAAEKGHLAVVQYLVEQGAEPDAPGYGGTTALVLATQFGHLEVVKYLVDQGAKVSALDDQPLDNPGGNDNSDTIRYLASRGLLLSAEEKKALGL